MSATVTRSEDNAAFTKHPTTFGVGKDRANQARIDIGSVEKHRPPTETTVLSFQEVGARFVIRFQSEQVALSYQPANLFISKVDVAQIVFGQRVESVPRLAAVDRFQQRAATAGDPASVLIEKVNAVQPGHGACGLTSPGGSVGRRQKAEGRKQKAEGRSQNPGNTRR